ncbi:CRAL/TRIO domain protein, partial [Opisthorchis viverrini]
MDMQGLGLKHLSPSWLSLVGEAVTVIESNYPEVLGACFVINAPPLFSRLYSLVKPLLSKATQEKVQVLDSNYPETLLQHCDAESLPAVYGGSLIDPDGDPSCPSRICWAGPVPDSQINQSKQPHAPPPVIRVALSRSASAQSLGSSEQFSVVEVARGGQRDIPVGFLPGLQFGQAKGGTSKWLEAVGTSSVMLAGEEQVICGMLETFEESWRDCGKILP